MLTPHVLLVPNLPTLILDQHRGHHTPMLAALAEASERFLAEMPHAVVVLSARWQAPGPFLVDVAKRHGTITDYIGFGVEVRYDCQGMPALARALVEAGQKKRVHVGPTQRGVDSGISVPMHFLAPTRDVPVVPLSIAQRTPAECRVWGATLRDALAARRERVSFVVGGLLSFAEHDWSLRREVPEAKELDERVLALLAAGDWSALAGLAGLTAKAQPQAGLRHLELLRGFLGHDAPGVLRCYESGPGVGAALIEFPLPESVVAPAPPPAGGHAEQG